MTQIEISCRISEMRDEGKHVVMIVPEARELPSPDEVYQKMKVSAKRLLITEIDGCYVTSISRVSTDDYIDRAVQKIFERAEINSAWGVFFL